jgi:hypothetical protein
MGMPPATRASLKIALDAETGNFDTGNRGQNKRPLK